MKTNRGLMMLSAHRHTFFRQLLQRSRSCRGMTLVELMVVTAIFGVVIGAIYSLMLPVQKSTFVQTQVVDMQDNLRLALDQITQDVRHAGLMVDGDAIDNIPDDHCGGPVAVPAREFTLRLRTPPQSLGARIVNYAYSAPIDFDSSPRAADILEPAGSTFRFDPPLLTARFGNGTMVKIVDAVEKRVIRSDVPVLINDVAGNDGNVNDANRYNDNTITFNMLPAELEAITPDEKVLYVMPMEVGIPPTRTITYVFDPNDNSMPGGARPTLRRYEDWPPDDDDPATPFPSIHPIPPNTPNRLLLGGSPPVAGDNYRKTFDAQFRYCADTHQVTIDITGRTEAYERKLRSDVPEDETTVRSAGAKPRQLRTTVALRNAIHTY